MDGEGMQVSCTPHFKILQGQQEIQIDVLKKKKKELINKAWLIYTGMDSEFKLEWQNSKDKVLTRLF